MNTTPPPTEVCGISSVKAASKAAEQPCTRGQCCVASSKVWPRGPAGEHSPPVTSPTKRGLRPNCAINPKFLLCQDHFYFPLFLSQTIKQD